MPIQIYNTLTRKKELFEPLAPEQVTIYNCGPTVYDHFHIGNARNFVVMDIVRRVFERRGFKVRFVQNLTDIDDKIINKANADGITADAVTAKYIPLYFEDARKLRIRPADEHPKATEHITDIIALIGKLVTKGLAYAADSSVYFSVKSFPGYGKLSGRRIEDMLDGARVEISEHKRDPGDFALWKAAKPGEPEWESPWGMGRPGWHIECSCMAMKHLGETIDIHAGGSDLIFPHHENEIAQSEGATGKPFARFWMHNGFLNIDSEKMSKSLGNFMKIDQVLERAPAEAVRHFLLSAHYRSPLDLTENALQVSKSAVSRINEGIETAEAMLRTPNMDKGGDSEQCFKIRQQFEAALDDDFNTPKALVALFDSISLIHHIRSITLHATGGVVAPPLKPVLALAKELRDFFGLEPTLRKQSFAGNLEMPSLELRGSAEVTSFNDKLIELLIDTRKLAREAKAFNIADQIRNRLGEMGIILEDQPLGTIWKKKD